MQKREDTSVAGYTVSDNFICLENLRRTSSEMYITYCGWEINEPRQLYSCSNRRNHVLHFVLSGKGTFRAGDIVRELGRGSIFYIPAGTDAEYVADEQDPWCYFWIGYNGIRAEEYSTMAGLSAEEPVGQCEEIDRIHEMVDEILHAPQPLASNELHRAAVLMEIFSILIREKEKMKEPGSASVEEPDFVRMAIRYISQNYDKNIRIHDLASQLGVSRSYLSSCFRKSVGCSPQTFILNLRMERAGSLLRTTTLPVNIISAAVGYQDQLAFSKIFKQFYGVSPRDFRKSGQEVKVFDKKGDFIYQGL